MNEFAKLFSLKLPRKGTKTLQLLEFMAESGGLRFSEIQRFIVELAGKDYDEMEQQSCWPRLPNGQLTKRTVRRWRGWWCTNLCYGPDSILHKYCEKGPDNLWYLKMKTKDLLAETKKESPVQFDAPEYNDEPEPTEFNPGQMIETVMSDGSHFYSYEVPKPKPKLTVNQALMNLQNARMAAKALSEQLNKLSEEYRIACTARTDAEIAVRDLLDL